MPLIDQLDCRSLAARRFCRQRDDYRWYGKDGQLKADKQEQLRDLNYLILLDSARYQNNDPLRYEKAMLDRWSAETARLRNFDALARESYIYPNLLGSQTKASVPS